MVWVAARRRRWTSDLPETEYGEEVAEMRLLGLLLALGVALSFGARTSLAALLPALDVVREQVDRVRFEAGWVFPGLALPDVGFDRLVGPLWAASRLLPGLVVLLVFWAVLNVLVSVTVWRLKRVAGNW